jgi:hypothetical protein
MDELDDPPSLVWACSCYEAAMAARLEAIAEVQALYPLPPQSGQRNPIFDQFNIANALLHCTWQCRIAREVDPLCARVVGDLHELEGALRGNDPAGSAYDRHNNRVGRELAAGRGGCLHRCRANVSNCRLAWVDATPWWIGGCPLDD